MPRRFRRGTWQLGTGLSLFIVCVACFYGLDACFVCRAVLSFGSICLSLHFVTAGLIEWAERSTGTHQA